MARGRHRAPTGRQRVRRTDVAETSSVEPVRSRHTAIYDPSVPHGPAPVPRRGRSRRARRPDAPVAGGTFRLTLVDPRHRAVTVGAMAVVATVGVTGLVLTSSAAPAPHRAAAPAVLRASAAARRHGGAGFVVRSRVDRRADPRARAAGGSRRPVERPADIDPGAGGRGVRAHL